MSRLSGDRVSGVCIGVWWDKYQIQGWFWRTRFLTLFFHSALKFNIFNLKFSFLNIKYLRLFDFFELRKPNPKWKATHAYHIIICLKTLKQGSMRKIIILTFSWCDCKLHIQIYIYSYYMFMLSLNLHSHWPPWRTFKQSLSKKRLF